MYLIKPYWFIGRIAMLDNFLKCLNHKDEVSIVYLGGSITEGAGASSLETCWQGLFAQWLDDKFPDSQMKHYNAGVGGTNSELGVFRMEKDVLLHNPDLLFVEFAVNDYGREEIDIIETMEGIVRKSKRYNPFIDIIFVHTVTMKMSQEFYELGKVPISIIAQEKVASYYHIPICNVGRKLLAVMKENKSEPVEYLPDMVHPSDKGYMVYYLELKGFIEKLIAENMEGYYDVLEPMSQDKYKTCKMVPASVFPSDFRVEKLPLCGRFPEYISSDISGSELSLEFFGTGIGCLWMIAKDSGIISYSVDDNEWKDKSSWDSYALRFNRANHVMLEKDLKEGLHKLTIRVSDKKDGQSEGNFIRIGAFLIV